MTPGDREEAAARKALEAVDEFWWSKRWAPFSLTTRIKFAWSGLRSPSALLSAAVKTAVEYTDPAQFRTDRENTP